MSGEIHESGPEKKVVSEAEVVEKFKGLPDNQKEAVEIALNVSGRLDLNEMLRNFSAWERLGKEEENRGKMSEMLDRLGEAVTDQQRLAVAKELVEYFDK